ncbi:uncharacterized protein LOC108629728 [Ceratina calcarata]|uniref:Uncharacterized protein LOC108629728 n=1 Tax=Ceratina calcarata TaxID=156304 RepID=A0AAJ7JAB3_9HYME|nr:uncharacterized protein LOC108629728 [Ceratina calcarata]
MVPTRSTRSSSRRSSILKTPKRRQPLTKLNFDNSSNESSPATTKIKRRVSFAEKKHVKEFCNSVDQGTVWDNTYEEHDLSSISKVPCGSNEQQFEDKDVSKESVSIHRETSNVQFSCNDSVNEGVNVEQINVHVEDVVEDIRYQSAIIGAALSDQFHDAQENENVCSIDLQLKSNSRISGSISVYQDETAEMLGEVVELSRSRVHNLVCNEISSKSVQSKCMEFTQGTCNTEYLELNCIQNNRTEDIVKDKSINVQQFDAAKADVRCNLQSYYNETNRCSTNLFLEDKENRNILPDDSMEFTEVAQKFHRSTVIQKTPMNKYNNLTQDEITKVLNMSMEMTEAVPINVHSMISVQDRNETSFSNNFKKLKYDPEMYDTVKFDETRYCDDELMEFTTVVTTSPKSTEEINLELPKRSTQHLCSSISIRNETDIFPESCMTMTKVVSSLGTNNDCENVDSVMIKPASEKTVVFPNASMEITEAVMRARNFTPTEDLIKYANFVNGDASKSLPQVDLQKSMEFTEAVSRVQPHVESELLLKSMEITEAVPRPRTIVREEDPQKSMEFTEAVSRVQPHVQSELLLKSMEITEAVPRPQTLIREEDLQKSMEFTEAVSRVPPHVESELLLKSMEITEAVPRPQTLIRDEDIQKSIEFTETVSRVQPHVQSELLLKSMEITEAVPRPQTLIRDEDIQKSIEFTETVSRVQPHVQSELLLKSMEITEAVPRPQTLIRDEDIQKSIEFTETVSRVQPHVQSELLLKSMEITEAVPRPQTLIRDEDIQKSIEFTETVSRVQPHVQSELLLKSMEITEAVPRPQTLIRDEDIQKSIEFTETVSRVQPHVQSELLLKSMEITEAVPRPRTLIREEDSQKSMEFTEAVSRVPPHVESELLLKSMEITEAVPRPQTLIRDEDIQKSIEFTETVSRVQPHVEPELLLKSMEITEAVPRPRTLIREEDSQKSMEFTEAVSRVQPYVESETRLKSMEIIETPFSAETRVQKEDLQKSVEIVESVIQERSPIRTKDADVNLTKTERPLEKIANRGLTSLSNFEKNDATNFDTISNKQNCNMYKNLENDDAEGSVSIEIQTFANNKSSMALHESMQLENCASAVKTSNAEVACAALNSASSVNSEIKIPALTLTKSSHRRTYVIQPSINDCTFTVNRNRNSRHCEIDIDINNKEASSSQDDVQNSQNDEDFDVENSKVLMPSGLEDIESIKPPSFSCLNDLSNTPMNINEDQEFMEEVISLSKDNDNDHEHASKFEHPEANVLRNVPKSQTFLTKNSSAGNTLGNLKIEQEDRIAGTDVIPKPQLLDNGDINMDIQVLECSSSTINGDENSPPLNKEQNLRPTCTLNSKLENQIEVRSSPKIEPAHERELKESNDEPNEADAEHYTLSVEENVIRKLKVCAKSDDIIWEVFYEDLDKKKLFVIGFISCSLLVVVYLQERCNFRSIKEIKLISRLPEDADVLISMVHRLMIEKIDTTQLLSRFSVYDDILPLLDYISKEVKIVMDFMFDLERLKNLNLMEFTRDSVSFISQSDRKNIILKVTVNIKPFEKIGPEDVSVHSLFGSLRDDNALKKLITNVKRDHKFLRRFIQDVKSYISIEEDFLNQI